MSNTTSDLKPIKGKCIYTTKGAAREYGRIGCNFFKGCPHECEYCYLKRGAPSAELGGNTAVLKKCLVNEDKALEIFCKEARKHIEVWCIFIVLNRPDADGDQRPDVLCHQLLHQ